MLVDGVRRFDEVAAGRCAIVTTADASAAQRTEIERRGGVLLTAGPGTDLRHWLRRGGAIAALVRPDGPVLCTAKDTGHLCAALGRA